MARFDGIEPAMQPQAPRRCWGGVSTLYDPSWAAEPRSSPAARDRIFFTLAGLAVVVTVFAGFARTYYLAQWLPQPARTPEFTPLLQAHAGAFTLWILLGALQPALIAAGRVKAHIVLGTAGVALAFAVWVLGNIASIEAMKVGYKGVGDPHAFYAVTFFSMQAFGIITALGIAYRRQAELHKRLMLLSSAAILEAAIGRLPLQLIVDTAPLSFYLGANLVIAAGMLHDRITHGRVHRVWIWGGGALIASQIFRVVIMNSEPWLAFARGMSNLW